MGKPVISYEYGGDDHDYDDHDNDHDDDHANDQTDEHDDDNGDDNDDDNDDDDDNNDDNNVKDDDNIATCTEFWRQGHSLSWWQP